MTRENRCSFGRDQLHPLRHLLLLSLCFPLRVSESIAFIDDLELRVLDFTLHVGVLLWLSGGTLQHPFPLWRRCHSVPGGC